MALLALPSLGRCHHSVIAVALGLPPLKTIQQAARKLPLLVSGDASKNDTTDGTTRLEENDTASGNPEVADTTATSGVAPSPEPASVLGGGSSDTHVAGAGEETTAANEVADNVGQGMDGLGAKSLQNNGDTAGADGDDDDDTECSRPSQGNAYDNDGGGGDDDDDDDDENSSRADGRTDSNDWADVEASERTGYAGAAVEPFVIKEEINGSCVMEVTDKKCDRPRVADPCRLGHGSISKHPPFPPSRRARNSPN